MAGREMCSTGRAEGSQTPTTAQRSKHQCGAARRMALHQSLAGSTSAGRGDTTQPQKAPWVSFHPQGAALRMGEAEVPLQQQLRSEAVQRFAGG